MIDLYLYLLLWDVLFFSMFTALRKFQMVTRLYSSRESTTPPPRAPWRACQSLGSPHDSKCGASGNQLVQVCTEDASLGFGNAFGNAILRLHRRNNSCEVFEIILKERMNRLNKNSLPLIGLTLLSNMLAILKQIQYLQFILLGIGRYTFEALLTTHHVRNTMTNW